MASAGWLQIEAASESSFAIAARNSASPGHRSRGQISHRLSFKTDQTSACRVITRTSSVLANLSLSTVCTVYTHDMRQRTDNRKVDEISVGFPPACCAERDPSETHLVHLSTPSSSESDLVRPSEACHMFRVIACVLPGVAAELASDAMHLRWLGNLHCIEIQPPPTDRSCGAPRNAADLSRGGPLQPCVIIRICEN